MPLKESEAIVLRSYPLGEGDRLVSFLDRQSGRLRGVARGARLPKSRFGSTLELLSYIRIWYFERETRELVRINQCELLESFLEAQKDYATAVALALFSEVTEAVLPEREQAEPNFRLLLLTARVIKARGPLPIAIAYFALWVVRLGGWLGSLEQCSRCGKVLGSEAGYASPGSAGIRCADCRGEWMKQISPAALDLGRKILSSRIEALLEVPISSAAAANLISYALDIVEHHIEKKLNSRKLLEINEETTS